SASTGAMPACVMFPTTLTVAPVSGSPPVRTPTVTAAGPVVAPSTSIVTARPDAAADALPAFEPADPSPPGRHAASTSSKVARQEIRTSLGNASRVMPRRCYQRGPAAAVPGD